MNEFLRVSEDTKRSDYANRIRLTQEKVEWISKRMEEDRAKALQLETIAHFAHLRRPANLSTPSNPYPPSLHSTLHNAVEKFASAPLSKVSFAPSCSALLFPIIGNARVPWKRRRRRRKTGEKGKAHRVVQARLSLAVCPRPP